MLKRVLALTGLFLYIMATAVTSLRVHACDGKWMAGFNLQSLLYKHASCHKNRDCCKHPAIQLQLNPDHYASDSWTLKVYFPLQTRISGDVSVIHFPNFSVYLTTCINHSPPLHRTRTSDRLSAYGLFLI